jgi:phosphohistidine phosphatase
MKTLYILRHAKADRDSESGQDFDRPLADRGWRDAQAVGREARSRGFEPDAILSSAAVRAAETVKAFARGYGPVEAKFEDCIYNAPFDRLIEIVSAATDSAEQLMIVGHNPGLQELARLLEDGPGDHADRLTDGLPTAGFVAIELNVEHWNEVRERCGRVTAMIVPRELN